MSLASLAFCVTFFLLQAKLHEKLLDHLGQVFGEMCASRDVLRRKILHKREFGSISLSTEEQQALGNLKKVSRTSAFSLSTAPSALLACYLGLLNFPTLFIFSAGEFASIGP
jgi:hypothetical protein